MSNNSQSFEILPDEIIIEILEYVPEICLKIIPISWLVCHHTKIRGAHISGSLSFECGHLKIGLAQYENCTFDYRNRPYLFPKRVSNSTVILDSSDLTIGKHMKFNFNHLVVHFNHSRFSNRTIMNIVELNPSLETVTLVNVMSKDEIKFNTKDIKRNGFGFHGNDVTGKHYDVDNFGRVVGEDKIWTMVPRALRYSFNDDVKGEVPYVFYSGGYNSNTQTLEGKGAVYNFTFERARKHDSFDTKKFGKFYKPIKVMEGNFLDDVPHGFCKVYTLHDGVLTYKGNAHNGVLKGNGLYVGKKNDGKKIYYGDFAEYYKDGIGSFPMYTDEVSCVIPKILKMDKTYHYIDLGKERAKRMDTICVNDNPVIIVDYYKQEEKVIMDDGESFIAERRIYKNGEILMNRLNNNCMFYKLTTQKKITEEDVFEALRVIEPKTAHSTIRTDAKKIMDNMGKWIAGNTLKVKDKYGIYGAMKILVA